MRGTDWVRTKLWTFVGTGWVHTTTELDLLGYTRNQATYFQQVDIHEEHILALC